MDASRFDTLARTLGTTDTRRALLWVLAGLPLGVTLTTLLGEGPEATAADDDHGSSHRRHRRKTRNARRSGDDKDNRKGKRKRKRKTRKPSCTPTTCAVQGKNCGVIPDGCGNQLRCGPDSCGNAFTCTDNVCRCADGTAVCQGSCCQPGQVCKDGPGPCCTPSTCAAQGKNCGTIADGCGGTLPCGSCPLAGQPCTNNVCGTCVPNCTGNACGADDDCGGTCQTGPCPQCQTCSGGTCTTVTDGTSCTFTRRGNPAIGRCTNGACTCVPSGEPCNCDIDATLFGCCSEICAAAHSGTTCVEDGICG